MGIKMNDLLYYQKDFVSKDGTKSFCVPHIYSPAITLRDDISYPTLDDASEKNYSELYSRLKTSPINKGGACLVFGTFDNLHPGHQMMLKIAASLGEELYVGIEDQTKALERKNFKHPILPNEDRITEIKSLGLTEPRNIFIRNNACGSIRSLRESGVNIKTIVVGDSQGDNPEIVKAVEYCVQNGIQVVATSRAKINNRDKMISSTMLHQMKLAKVGGMRAS